MNGKPVAFIDTKRILNTDSGFGEKLLCDHLTFSTGTSCCYKCRFCYVKSIMARSPNVKAVLASKDVAFEDVVIRRSDAIEILRSQLLDSKGRPKYSDPSDRRVIYASPLVDVAGNLELVRETIEACNLILEFTHWDIRLLSKSTFLPRVAAGIPSKWARRVVYGVSTGTLNDEIARAVEEDAPIVSKRIESLRELQDAGLRTFGMICPSLPQRSRSAYDEFSREAMTRLRAERLEHIWAEPINVRGESFHQTEAALRGAGFHLEAAELEKVSSDSATWERYARDTFEAHVRHAPQGKLRFLQYVRASNIEWWRSRISDGAVLLGAATRPKATESVDSS
jgi:DNA repair photolyase